ncbi:MAG: tetratricopeptide repeat protein, partial [Nitrospiraceae bacterium]
MRWFLFAVFLVLACATVAAADSYEDATSAFERKDYALAARIFRPLAEQGDAKAQYNLGVMYDKGQGLPQDYQEALKWYRKAAEQGQAQNNLGAMYDDGQGVPQGYQEALKWYRKAAEQGQVQAQYNLG